MKATPHPDAPPRQAHAAGDGLDAAIDIDIDIEDASPGQGEAERRVHRVEARQHGQRLDHVLVAMAPEFSRSHLQALVARGHVQLDGRAAGKPAARLQAGQQVQLELVPTDESRAFVPQPMSLDVLHEDDDLLVLHKPVGLVVHPAPGHWSGTLLNGLLAHHTASATLPRAGIVHRLDKDTSGVMMVGKSLEAVTALVRDLAAREVHRQYLALMHPGPPTDRLRVDRPIGRDRASRLRMAVIASGRPAVTDFRVTARRDGFAAVQCVLHTGRTHQIRVHAASLGGPLVGDALYGGRPGLGLGRQGLHAFRLQLTHPRTRVALQFQAQPPADFDAAWREVVGAAPAWVDD